MKADEAGFAELNAIAEILVAALHRLDALDLGVAAAHVQAGLDALRSSEQTTDFRPSIVPTL